MSCIRIFSTNTHLNACSLSVRPGPDHPPARSGTTRLRVFCVVLLETQAG